MRLEPFLCDIEDLNKGNVDLSNMYKRQIISPFDLKFEMRDIIEVNGVDDNVMSNLMNIS